MKIKIEKFRKFCFRSKLKHISYHSPDDFIVLSSPKINPLMKSCLYNLLKENASGETLLLSIVNMISFTEIRLKLTVKRTKIMVSAHFIIFKRHVSVERADGIAHLNAVTIEL